MKFKSEILVLGVKVFNDRVEGVMYDFTKLKVVMPAPENSKTEFGSGEVVMQWGDHTNADKLRQVDFPAVMELELTATSKGFEVVSCRPVARTAQQPKAA